MKSILFITTSSLAANPRLVKEVESLKIKNQCTVISFWHENWSGSLTQNIIKSNPEVVFIQIDRKKELLSTLCSKIKHKIAIQLNPLFKNNLNISAYASNDKTPQLVLKAMKWARKKKVNTVIAHNLGALYPALKSTKNGKARLQLDIEDFYPGEALYYNRKYETGNRNHIMQKAINAADTITYASEGIAQKCQATYSISESTQQATIINSFNQTDFPKPKSKQKDSVRCVWFSQYIGPNRGLEQIFKSAKDFPHIEFHLVGNRNEDYLEKQHLSHNIILHPIMTQEKLHAFLSDFDIGLALESADADENRDICLTNKILAYAQAGLYVLATMTQGQIQFLNALDYSAGELIDIDLSSSLSQLDIKALSIQEKQKRWEKAKNFAWEQEQKKLLKLMQ